MKKIFGQKPQDHQRKTEHVINKTYTYTETVDNQEIKLSFTLNTSNTETMQIFADMLATGLKEVTEDIAAAKKPAAQK